MAQNTTAILEGLNRLAVTAEARMVVGTIASWVNTILFDPDQEELVFEASEAFPGGVEARRAAFAAVNGDAATAIANVRISVRKWIEDKF